MAAGTKEERAAAHERRAKIFEGESKTGATQPYSMVRQEPGINLFTKILPNSPNELNDAIPNPVTGNYEITRGGFTLTMPSFLYEKGIKTPTHKAFDFLRIQFSKNGQKKRLLFSLDDYMAFRGIKNRTQAAGEIDTATEAFMQAELSYKAKTERKGYKGMRVVQDADTEDRQRIEIALGDKFAELLRKSPQMWYCNAAGATDDKHNKSAYYIITKLAEHKRMNIAHPNETVISVETLLANTPTIPSYNFVVSKKRGALERYIMKPFERALDALADAGELSWCYCMAGGAQLATGEEHLFYKTWIELNIKFYLLKYPDTGELREIRDVAKDAKKQRKLKAIRKAASKEPPSLEGTK